MVSLGSLLLSSFIALIGGISVSQFSEGWRIALAVGLAIFILLQFGIITPFRMWRKSVWVANIEQMLEQLWDCHDRGVILLNAHYNMLTKNPELARDSQLENKFIDDWSKQLMAWTEETTAQIEKLYPLEAKRFKNLVLYNPHIISGGLNEVHDGLRSMLVMRLKKIDAIVERHQPSLLPE